MHGTIGTMQIMDRTGHSVTTWDPTKPDEVQAAQSMFDTLSRKGYSGFRVEGADNQGERMRSFDPKAGKIMMVMPLVGG